MKIKLFNNYITETVDETEQPIEFTTAIFNRNGNVILIDSDNTVKRVCGGYAQSCYTLEGGDWTPEPPTQEENEKADSDSLLLEVTQGSVSQQSKARLYARQIHEGKVTYPSGVPADLRADVYTAYTEHYKYQPALPVISTLADSYTVDDPTVFLVDGSLFPSSGVVTISDNDHTTLIEFGDRKDNELNFCRCVDGDKGVTYSAGCTVKLN